MTKKTGWLLSASLAGLGIMFFASRRWNGGIVPQDLDQYLSQSESEIPHITPQTEKTITWANPAKTRTALSVVYLHGYSATRQETAPLANEIAAQLGANLFCTRLCGHGLSGEALAQATVNDWLNDAMGAVEIGKRLGDKVIVMGVSTGGRLPARLRDLDRR